MMQSKFSTTLGVLLLEETYLRFSPVIQERGLNFMIMKPAEALIAQVDEEAIKKILSNLYSNAVKYSNHAYCYVCYRAMPTQLAVR